jgi:integrase
MGDSVSNGLTLTAGRACTLLFLWRRERGIRHKFDTKSLNPLFSSTSGVARVPVSVYRFCGMRYLKRRRQTWFARVTVPQHLRATMGRDEIVRTLRTRDLALAKRKLHAVLADIQRDIATAEANRELSPESAEYVLEAAREARARVDKGLQSEGEAEVALDASIDKHLDRLRAKHGEDEHGDPRIDDGHVRAIQLAHRVFAGEPVTLLSAQAEAHMSEIASSIRKTTLASKRKALHALQNWLGTDVEVAAVTRRVAGRYLTESLMKRNRAAKTTKTELSHISSCWNWMLARGVVEANPWLRMGSSLPTNKRGTEAPRRPWTDAEVLQLLKGTPTNDPLWSLSALALYTGARIEELCSLKLADVDGGVFQIREGKSAAAVRSVPVHPVIAPLVKQLVKNASDSWLVPGLLTGGRDARRSAGASKRFGYHLRHALKLTDTALTFHSLRHSFVNRCEAAGVPVTTTALIVGHAGGRSGLTYGQKGASYSGGLPVAELAKAIQKLSYGDADEIVKRATGKVRITVRSRRRPKRAEPEKKAA